MIDARVAARPSHEAAQRARAVPRRDCVRLHAASPTGAAHAKGAIAIAAVAMLLAACDAPPSTAPLDGSTAPRDGGCATDEQCSDGLFCNGAERCETGVCLAPLTRPCVDAGVCSEARGRCDSAEPCVDADRDGACATEDCDDANAARYPGALERCDAIDQDCDPTTFGPDSDGDGLSAIDCCNPQPGGGPVCGSDCDDTRDTVKPSALESCNGRDDDCDGLVDEQVLLTFYRDVDGDNAGDTSMTMQGCSAPTGYALTRGDCNDADPRFRPGGVDSCDVVGDDNCDGAPDDGCTCTTGASQECGPAAQHMVGICLKGTQRCIAGRWESSCPGAVFPAVELCNRLDDDCDGAVDDGVCVACPAGYSGVDGGCVDVDECAAFACGPSGVACVNTPGAYACTCAAGYSAPPAGGTCVNVNECAAATNPCGIGTCTDLAGSYRCSSCPSNYVEVTSPAPACVWDVPALVDLGTNSGVLVPSFQADTLAYTLPLQLGVQSLTMVPLVPEGFEGTITVQGQAVVPGRPSAPLSLPLGGLDITVVVRSTSGRVRTYVVHAARGFEPGSGTYLKASNTDTNDLFGDAVALSADGSTLAVGASREDSSATGIQGSQTDRSASRAGAVYVFRRTRGRWVQEAYVKASNTGANDNFGAAVALSADGSSLAVGAAGEDSSATGVNGNQADNAASGAGAVYVFRRTGSTWAQEAYVKASNTGADDRFGVALAISGDGATLAVGAGGEDSSATGVGGNQADDSASASGACYVFRRMGTTWMQTAYVKASNTGAQDQFGDSLALSSDGSALAVGAVREASGATGIGGDQTGASAPASGAVYVIRLSGSAWAQEAYVKASNNDADDQFGSAVALSADGTTLAVGARNEASSATGVGGDQSLDSARSAGAAYVFRRTAGVWAQEAYVKASNTGAGDTFGVGLSLSSDGATLAVGAAQESSGAGGSQVDDSALGAGAVYVFRRLGTAWAQQDFVKATNPGADDRFGEALALSADGSALAVGANREASSAAGLGGDQSNNSVPSAGAAYVREVFDRPSFERFVKSSNSDAGDSFGAAIAVSADGSTLAIGAPNEASSARGVNGDQSIDSAPGAGAVYVFGRMGSTWVQRAYLKASNADASDAFGYAVALSADGSMLAVGACGEASGVVGNPADDSAGGSGAVYVFREAGGAWGEEAYLKASSPGVDDTFGVAVALSADGSTLAVGASAEDSRATGIGGDATDDGTYEAGAVYVFRRAGSGWSQEAYVKAPNTGSEDAFGDALAVSADGSTLAVGAPGEASRATGVGGDQLDDSAFAAGAVYVLRRTGGVWAHEAYIKASNGGTEDRFGEALALSADGGTLAVGAPGEASSASGIGGNQADDAAPGAGAVFVLRRTGNAWFQEAYVKSSNAGAGDAFGVTVSLSADGTALVVGASGEGSRATGVGGDQADNSALRAGAAYVLRRTGTRWAQRAYVKASFSDAGDSFGAALALSADGSMFCVGASGEDSSAAGVGSNAADNGSPNSGAASTYRE